MLIKRLDLEHLDMILIEPGSYGELDKINEEYRILALF